MLPWWNSGSVYAQDLDAGDYIFYIQYSKDMKMQAAVISYARKECAPIDGQKCETFSALAQGSKDEKKDDKRDDKKDDDNKKEKGDVTPKKHDDDQDKEERDSNSGGGGKKKTRDDKDDEIYDSLPKGDLSKEAKALREMIMELLKLIEEVDKKQQAMKGKDADLQKTKEELEAKVEELQKKLKAINEQIEANKGKDSGKFKDVMAKAVSAIGDLVKGFKDIKGSLVQSKKIKS